MTTTCRNHVHGAGLAEKLLGRDAGLWAPGKLQVVVVMALCPSHIGSVLTLLTSLSGDHTQECWSPGTASLPLDGREQALGQKVPGVAYGRMPLTVNRLAVSGLHMGARDSPLPPPFSRRHKLGEVKFIVQSHTVVG